MIKQTSMSKGVAQSEFDYIAFGFGLDLVTPSNQCVPGSLRDVKNYEVNINGGYTGIDGYERFNGKPSPSDAVYYRLDVTFSAVVEDGQTITDITNAGTNTGVVIEVVTDATQPYLIVTRVVGTLGHSTNTNTIQVGGVTKATTNNAMVSGGAATSALDAEYASIAADQYRPDILVVPGEGDILGVWMFNDIVYAWRNTGVSSKAAMYKSSAGGWVLVSLGRSLAYTSGGTTEIEPGDTITGITSGATAVVTNISLDSGTWAGGDAAGTIYFMTQTASFQSENIKTSPSGQEATVGGNSVVYEALAGGRFEFDTYNFGGSTGTVKVYGADGVNLGFEFDGTTFTPIPTGMASDMPSHVQAHKRHLFFSFGGSCQHSGIGTPLNWSPYFGAAELAVGDTITGFKVQPGSEQGGSMAIISRNRINMLYGSNAGAVGAAGAWELVQYREEVGAFAYSIQEFGQTMMMDDRGITTLDSTYDFGNFGHSVVSKLVQPFINTRKTSVTASSIAREKSQYRVFFNDATSLYITTDNKDVMGIMKNEFTNVVKCVCSLEDSSGNEVMYFGSDNGYVYQMDKGRSFDGAEISRSFTTHFDNSKSPRIEKSYLDGSFEISGAGYAQFNFRYELGYNQVTIPQPAGRDVSVAFSSAAWDTMVWDNFVWDGSVLSPSNIDLSGSGENISMIFSSSSNYYAPLTFSGAQLRQVLRKQLRS
mgnify:FL=1